VIGHVTGVAPTRNLLDMRIVAGELRGRRLAAPADGSIRPTTDKVREAIFNALASLDVIVDARVADLYAGTGALGIEALSRGAAHCTFVERARASLASLNDNIRSLGLGDRARVVVGDPVTVASRLDVDVVFADPPYGFDDWPRLLAAFGPERVRLVVAEAAGPVAAPAGWEQGRVKRYGRTWVTFLHPAPA
jgi:16S rRNA (guanine966-N2)-methyltransferase